MYHGITKQSYQQPRMATQQHPYGMPNKVQSVQIKGMSGVGQEFYGPPRPGQSWSAFQDMMSMRGGVSIASGIAAATLINPMIGIGAGLLTWALTPGLASKQKSKSIYQGG